MILKGTQLKDLFIARIKTSYIGHKQICTMYVFNSLNNQIFIRKSVALQLKYKPIDVYPQLKKWYDENIITCEQLTRAELFFQKFQFLKVDVMSRVHFKMSKGRYVIYRIEKEKFRANQSVNEPVPAPASKIILPGKTKF